MSSALDAEVSLALLSDQVHGSDMSFSPLDSVLAQESYLLWVPEGLGLHPKMYRASSGPMTFQATFPLSLWCDSRALGGVTLAFSYGLKVCVSILSACTSASLEPSYVLRAIGTDEDLAHSSIRSVHSAAVCVPVCATVLCLVR